MCEDADLDLANGLQSAHFVRVWCNLGNRALSKNQLIVGPRLRSSKVLRDTIGERFLFDQKRSRFVNEFVSLHRSRERKSSSQRLAETNSRLRILSL